MTAYFRNDNLPTACPKNDKLQTACLFLSMACTNLDEWTIPPLQCPSLKGTNSNFTYGLVWLYEMYLFCPLGSFKVLYSLEWYCMVMESLIWSFMVCMILCGLVWLSIVYYANVFPCKVSNGLVWLCTVLYGLTQLCTIFVLVKWNMIRYITYSVSILWYIYCLNIICLYWTGLHVQWF